MKISKIIVAIVIGSMISITSCKDSNTKTETTQEQVIDGIQKNEAGNQEEFNVNGKVKNSLTTNHSNTATIVIKANKALEYKFKINQYEKLKYEWTADTPLRYDFHGDPEDKDSYSKGYFESYANGTSDAAKGNITIPYNGSHGWYWKNTSTKDITITLTTKGNYNIIGVIQ